MNSLRVLLAFSVLGLLPATAEVPRKMPIEKLHRLSLFPVKHVEPETPLPPNPIDDYTLAGMAKLEDGWFVVLMNRKDRSTRIRISPNHFTEDGFRVVSVEAFNSSRVRVQIEARGHTSWVKFEPKIIFPRKVPAKAIGRPKRVSKIPSQQQRRDKK